MCHMIEWRRCAVGSKNETKVVVADRVGGRLIVRFPLHSIPERAIIIIVGLEGVGARSELVIACGKGRATVFERFMYFV